MKKGEISVVLFTSMVIASHAFADVWRESTVADFADGFFNANVFVSNEGLDSGQLKSVPGATYDLNKDSWPDLVISNMQGPASYIYWGSASGFDSTNRTLLPTSGGATGNSIDDLNRDGHLDIVFSIFNDNSSVIYWGSKTGFNAADTARLPSYGAHGNYICDLNHDGKLDIIIANWFGSESYIYWGLPHGQYLGSHRTALPTSQSYDVAVADLDKDGRLDIVFSNGWDPNLKSFIYWGQGTDSIYYSPAYRTDLTAGNAQGVSIGDIDRDGWLDIVFSNNGSGYVANSYIYWGSPSGFTDANRTPLPSLGARGNSIADLDRDGNADIVIANWYDNVTHDIPSYIYWGPNFNVSDRTELPGHGAVGPLVGKFLKTGPDVQVLLTNGIKGPGFYGTSVHAFTYLFNITHDRVITLVDSMPSVYAHLSTKDNGNVHDRGPEEHYTSSVYGDEALTRVWGECHWTSQIPVDASVDVFLRSGNTANPDDGTWCDWSAVPSSGFAADIPASKYAQYRLRMESNQFFEAPTFDEISLNFEPMGVSGENPAGQGTGWKSFSCRQGGRSVIFEFSSPTSGWAKVAVFNMMGQRLATPVNSSYPAGKHVVTWNLPRGTLPTGTYFIRASIGERTFCDKLLFVK